MSEIPEINWDQKAHDEEALRKQNEKKYKDKQYKEFRRRLVNEIFDIFSLIFTIIIVLSSIFLAFYYFGFWPPNEGIPLGEVILGILGHLTKLPLLAQLAWLFLVIAIILFILLCCCYIEKESNKD